MIFVIENILQISVLFLCSVVAVSRALKFRSRTWTLLSFFFGSWILDDLYWLLYAWFFDEAAPSIGVLSDLNWYASYIFLYLLIRHLAPPESAKEKRLLPWLGFVFSFGMASYYMQWGNVLSNILYAMLLGMIIFTSIRRLMDRASCANVVPLCIVSLLLCAFEYGLWTSSCIWYYGTLKNPYYWFDVLLSLTFPFFIAATGKAVRT